MTGNFNGKSCVDVENAGKDGGAGSMSSKGNSSTAHHTINIMGANVFKAFDGPDLALCNDINRFIIINPWQKIPCETEWSASTIEVTKAYQKYLEEVEIEGYTQKPELHNYKWNNAKLQEKAAQGYNIGLLCTHTAVFDADNVARLTELGIMDKLPKTRTVRTARGGTHLLYNVTGEKQYKLVLYDPERGHEETDEKTGKTRFVFNHLGELLIGKFQVVCAGSTYRKVKDEFKKSDILKHPEWTNYQDCFEGPELPYTLANDLPIATISFDDILEIVKDLKLSKVREKGRSNDYTYDKNKQRLVDRIGLKVEDLIKDTSEFRYCGDEIQGPHPVHGSENGHNFAFNPVKNTFCCYRCNSGGDAITLVAVLDDIIDCTQAVKWEDANGEERSFWASEEGSKLFPKVLDAIRARGFTVPELKKYELTEIGNAERFIDTYGNDLRYFTNKGNWLYWNNKMWADCSHMEQEQYCKEIPKAIKEEAEDITNEAYRDKVYKWAKSSASFPKIKNTLSLARSDPRVVISIADFYQDTRYFNMQNGVLDTETLEFLPHDRKRMLTKMSNVFYEPKAKCPLWIDMMDLIFNKDAELVKFVQRTLGYLLTGKPIEQAWFFLYGETSKNGKSTFCNAVEFLMGEYAKKVNIKTFLKENKSSIPNDIAALAGYYFIWASEPNDGKELSMEVIKPFSGNEPMDARFLNKEFFQFRPQGSIFIIANNRPVIKEKGDAAWRRVLSVPFEVQIPEEKRDLNIDEKLKAEASGIFNWMLEGLKAYKEMGNKLCPPMSVVNSTSEYKEDMNSFKKFWVEMVQVEESASISNSELWARYKDFCVEYGANSGLKKEFVDQLRSFEKQSLIKGFISHKQQYWKGIRPKTDGERDEN